jgi:hypothetical protein
MTRSNFQLVSANSQFRAEWKNVKSRAELWLEPARLGLITSIYGEDFSLDIGGLMAGYFGKTDLWLLNLIEIRNLKPVGKLYISYL